MCAKMGGESLHLVLDAFLFLFSVFEIVSCQLASCFQSNNHFFRPKQNFCVFRGNMIFKYGIGR